MSTLRQMQCSSRGCLAGVRGWSIALLVGAAGCASAPPSEHEIAYARSMSPTIELATTPTEELALERADSLPPGERTELGDGVVIAGPIYPSASGRRCREMSIGTRHRLACEDLEGEVWVFVPDVFTARPTAGGETANAEASTTEGEGGEGNASEGSS